MTSEVFSQLVISEFKGASRNFGFEIFFTKYSFKLLKPSGAHSKSTVKIFRIFKKMSSRDTIPLMGQKREMFSYPRIT
jgi:hypothetical protein